MALNDGLRRLAPALLVLAGSAAWANAVGGAFVFDDSTWIVDNPEIRSLTNLPQLVSGTSRPVWKLTLAVDHAIGGLDPTGYHLTNVAIHVLAALALYGALARTLESPRLGGPGGRWHSAARGLAVATALLWLVHPLQTQAVTYVTQRCESLMGLFYLTTLYAAIRFSSGERGRRAGWGVAAVAACALGMGTKEVMVSAPLVVLLHDRAFGSGSLGEALRRNGALHLGLAATWGVMFGMIGPQELFAGEMARPDLATVSPLVYAQSQPAVLLHYVRLALWPHPLCFHYDWPPARTAAEIVPPALALAVPLALTAWGLVRNAPLAFAGVWFFAILAPTSSLHPIQDLAFEHRMYLPLASVVALVVIGAHAALARAPAWSMPALVAAATLALAGATVLRNRDYHDPLVLWRSVARAAPHNPEAFYNQAVLLAARGRHEEAIARYRDALALDPENAWTHNNLGTALAKSGELEEALRHFARALALDPDDANTHLNRGIALRLAGREGEAIESLWRALELRPRLADAHLALGRIFEERGDHAEAARHFRSALATRPRHAEALAGLRRVTGEAGASDAPGGP